MFEQLLTTALHEIEASRPVLLVSVARATGSTPRKEGAMMLAGTQGLLCGTIGGGLLEHRCLSLAAVQPAHGHLEHFELDNRKAGSLGMVCGGSDRSVVHTADRFCTATRSTYRLAKQSAGLAVSAAGWLCASYRAGQHTASPADCFIAAWQRFAMRASDRRRTGLRHRRRPCVA